MSELEFSNALMSRDYAKLKSMLGAGYQPTTAQINVATSDINITQQFTLKVADNPKRYFVYLVTDADYDTYKKVHSYTRLSSDRSVYTNSIVSTHIPGTNYWQLTFELRTEGYVTIKDIVYCELAKRKYRIWGNYNGDNVLVDVKFADRDNINFVYTEPLPSYESEWYLTDDDKLDHALSQVKSAPSAAKVDDTYLLSVVMTKDLEKNVKDVHSICNEKFGKFSVAGVPDTTNIKIDMTIKSDDVAELMTKLVSAGFEPTITKLQ